VAVHQFVAALNAGDAVGGHTLRVQEVLREFGPSEVYTEHVAPGLEGRARYFGDYGKDRRRSRDVLLYQHAIGSRVADFVLSRPERHLLDHHNTTPPEFFTDWEPDLAHGLAWGREQLRQFGARGSVGIADSSYNEAELRAVGFSATAVVPILVDFDEYGAEADPEVAERLAAEEGTRVLFVGRVAPNKCQHDLVRAFAAYRRLYDPTAVLDVVGASSSAAYSSALGELVRDLGLEGSVRCTGGVPFPALLAHYRRADVFCCLSEHEGFCVPVLEAMHAGVPVVAYGVTAVPETVGDAGLLLERKDPLLVAAALDRVRRDGALRAQLAAAGRRRVEHFSLKRSQERLVAAIEALVDDPWR
jgi:glycosyltransferase involved in cell wall biosynthesis